jgi:hypothetical protein
MPSGSGVQPRTGIYLNSTVAKTCPSRIPQSRPAADQDEQRGRARPWPVQSRGMLVTDLHHFLDLPADTPGSTRRLAEHLSNIVRAATAGDAGTTWESALPCRRRCRGRMIVLLTESGVRIRWQCSVCDDEGMISNWEDSPFDLRRRRLTLAKGINEIVIPDEVAAALRELRLLDTDCERQVFGMRAHTDGALLAVTDDDLDELIGFAAAEANHEPNRRRQRRLDAAFEALKTAAQTLNGG